MQLSKPILKTLPNNLLQFAYIDDSFLNFANVFDDNKYHNPVFLKLVDIINISNFLNAIS